MALPHIRSSPRGKQDPRYTMGVPTSLSPCSGVRPASTASSAMGTALSWSS